MTRGWMTWAWAMVLAWRVAGAEDAPRWWKGNLHTHTLWSDGDDFPEVVARWYQRHGYQFLALSEHNRMAMGDRWVTEKDVLSRGRSEPWRASARPRDAVAEYARAWGEHWVERRRNPTNGAPEIRLKPLSEYRARLEQAGRFLLVDAEEITQNARNGRAIHIGAVNLDRPVPEQRGDTVPEVLRSALKAVREAAAPGGRRVLVHVNHPNYKWGVTAEDLASVLDERFFEIWNGVDADNDPGDARHPSTDEVWDIANTLRIAGMGAAPLLGIATDDSHDYQGNKVRAPPGRAWVMVRSRFLTPDSLVRAMESGDFYATTGVVLDDVGYDAARRTLSLRIQPRPGERFVTRFVGTRRGVRLEGRPRRDPDGTVVETTLDYASGDGPRIGEVLAEARGTRASYTLRGDELYVRAIVESSAAPDVPSVEHPFKRAWTQPVAWTTGSR